MDEIPVQPILEAVFNDEVHAFNTVRDVLDGKPVSAGDSARAAFTIGSDALMLVPGLGAGVVALKSGSRAAKAVKAATTARKARETTNAAIKASIKASQGGAYAAHKAAKTAAKAAKASKAYSKAIKAVKKTKGMTTRRSTEARDEWTAYMNDAFKYQKQKHTAKSKRKKSRPLRVAGHIGSNAGNAYSFLKEDE